MNTTLENEYLKVTVSDVGAELQSLILKETGREYLWQGDAAYWTGRASNLFPIVGRLTEGKYTYKGKTYEMNLHGFARKSNFKVKASPIDAVFTLEADEQTKAQYPFDFIYEVIYALKGQDIVITYRVLNKDTKEMIFAVGGHPGFFVPLEDGLKFDDYRLVFDAPCKPKMLLQSETCYLTGKESSYPLAGGKIIPLQHTLFDHDAIILKDMALGVTLHSPKGKHGVALKFPQMRYLGIWHKPLTQAPYVCIEPWSSVPAYHEKIDDLETKKDMNRLASGKTYQNSYTLTLF